MAHASLSTEPLQPDRTAALVVAPGYGAVVTFVGNVRDNTRGKRVLRLEYSGYIPLAEKQLAGIMEAAESRWTVSCAIAHRLGSVEVGEAAVVVAVASPHRAEAFDACRWLMDKLKDGVPIWKKEYYETGANWVEGSGTVPTD